MLKTNKLSVSGQSPADLLNAGKQMWASLGASQGHLQGLLAQGCHSVGTRPGQHQGHWHRQETGMSPGEEQVVMGTHPTASGQGGWTLPGKERTHRPPSHHRASQGHRGAGDGWCWGLGALCPAGRWVQPGAGLQGGGFSLEQDGRDTGKGQHYCTCTARVYPVKHRRLVIKVQAAQ